MLHEACTVNELARSIPRINVALEGRQVDHQSTMLEVEGKIPKTCVSILINSGASLNYIAPTIVEKFKLVLRKNEKMHGWYSWLQG